MSQLLTGISAVIVIATFVGLFFSFRDDYVRPALARLSTPTPAGQSTHLATPTMVITQTPSPSPTVTPIANINLDLYQSIPMTHGLYHPVQISNIWQWQFSSQHKILCSNGKVDFPYPSTVKKIYIFSEITPSEFYVLMPGTSGGVVTIKCEPSLPDKYQALYVYLQ